MVNGRKIPIIPTASTPETQFITEKFRSRNTANGTSGSRFWVSFWYSRNTASSTTPVPRISGMLMNEVIVPQLYFCPSTRP